MLWYWRGYTGIPATFLALAYKDWWFGFSINEGGKHAGLHFSIGPSVFYLYVAANLRGWKRWWFHTPNPIWKGGTH